MPQGPNDHLCPYCRARAMEAIATLPSVRGDGLGAKFNARTIAGCKSCVRKQLLVETLRSCLDGWSSPVAALANPVLITYGVARAGIVSQDLPRVQRMLEVAGIAEPPIEPVRIAYGLAAALIRADGHIDGQEIRVASSIGKQVFAEFNERDFVAVVEAGSDLPGPEDLASVFNALAGSHTKNAVYRYLVAVAAADNEVAPEERAVLRTVADNLGISGPGHGVDQSA